MDIQISPTTQSDSQLPTLWLPFSPRMHADVQCVARASARWASAHGLIAGDSAALTRFEAAGFAELAGRCWPELSRPALQIDQIAARWLARHCTVEGGFEPEA